MLRRRQEHPPTLEEHSPKRPESASKGDPRNSQYTNSDVADSGTGNVVGPSRRRRDTSLFFGPSVGPSAQTGHGVGSPRYIERPHLPQPQLREGQKKKRPPFPGFRLSSYHPPPPVDQPETKENAFPNEHHAFPNIHREFLIQMSHVVPSVRSEKHHHVPATRVLHIHVRNTPALSIFRLSASL